MRRRSLLRSLAALGLAPLARFDVYAQTSVSVGDAEIATLIALAEIVLPSAIGADGRKLAVDRFVRWIRSYREGADRGHGYGNSTLSAPSGPSPALRYPAQFAALDAAARAQGAASFAALASDKRQAIIDAALNEPQRATTLPARPTGNNLVADFMGYYFNSGDAYDLAYNAAIGRDKCRSLDGSGEAPPPLGVPRSTGRSPVSAQANERQRASHANGVGRWGPTSERVRGSGGTKSPGQ